MKGTFISSDYIKARDNSIRLVEVNTDTVVYGGLTEDEFSWQPLVDFISGSYTKLHIISKPEIHLETVTALRTLVGNELPSVAVTETSLDLLEIYPDDVEDAADKFILRMAYDDNAIIDSEYCKNSFKTLQLMHEYNHTSSIVPFYGVSGSTTYNTLNTSSYSENVPNAVVKWNQGNSDVMFHKITDWSAAKSALNADHSYLQSFEISSEAISDNVAWSYRNYSIIHGSSLSSIDLGTTIAYPKFSLPTVAQANIAGISSNTELDVKHYHEFSTSVIKKQRRREGLFNTEQFVSASGDIVAIADVTAGMVFKSFNVPGMPDTDLASTYSQYIITGSSFPAGSQITGSVVQGATQHHDNDEAIVIGLKYSGSAETYYLGPTTSLLSYSSGSDNIKFRTLSDITEEDTFLVDVNNNVVDIQENKLILLNSPTGSFSTVNLEPVDNVVIGNTPVFFAYHNNKQKCFMPGAEILMEDGSVKFIEEIKVGDRVQTKDGSSCSVEDTYVYNVKAIKKMYSKENLTVTDSHPLFFNGEWSTADKLGWESKFMFVDKLYNLKTNNNFIIEGIAASGTTHDSLNVTTDEKGYSRISSNKKAVINQI